MSSLRIILGENKSMCYHCWWDFIYGQWTRPTRNSKFDIIDFFKSGYLSDIIFSNVLLNFNDMSKKKKTFINSYSFVNTLYYQ